MNSSSSLVTDTRSPIENISCPAVGIKALPAHCVVGARSQDQIDADREQLIEECAKHMHAALKRWESPTGTFSDRADADTWLAGMKKAVQARSPAQLARMRAA